VDGFRDLAVTMGLGLAGVSIALALLYFLIALSREFVSYRYFGHGFVICSSTLLVSLLFEKLITRWSLLSKCTANTTLQIDKSVEHP